MDIELLEAFALSDDRTAALAQLVPGSEDHDYYGALTLQQEGKLDQVERILNRWVARHGHTERLEKLRHRQLLLHLGTKPAEVTARLRELSGANLSHQAEAAATAQRHPTRLDPAPFATAALIAEGVRRTSDLSQLTDEALSAVIDAELDAARRRVLLSRLSMSLHPRIVDLVAADLAEKGSRGFGTLSIHGGLTFKQLVMLAELRPELRQAPAWVTAILGRLQPPAHVDWRGDTADRAEYLDSLWQFLSSLPPTFNSLRVQVLYHRLDHDRRLGIYDRSRFLTYLALPRRVGYARAAWLRQVPGDQTAVLGIDSATGLAPVPDDEALVSDYLGDFLASENEEAFADWLDADWLAAQLATTRLLAGDADAERWAAVLGPARLAALRDRVDLDLTPQNPRRVGAGEEVAVEVYVKNVAALTVKVFRIDTLAWFLAHGTDVDASIDLDGLTAGFEETLRFTEPPIRRVGHRIPLPACDRPGTYVVELIGNGRSSRAVIRKGGLRHAVRIGAAGAVVTISDEAGRPLPDATIWLGGREYRPRDDGGIVIPFSTRPGPVPMLLVHGDVAVRDMLAHPSEAYSFAAGIQVDRQSLVAGQTARAVIRASLTIAGVPVPLALVEEPRATVTVTDLAGTSTSKEQPIELRDDRDTVLDWPVPEHLSRIEVVVRGRIRVVSEQRTIDVEDRMAAEVATLDRTQHTEALDLARTAGGWVLHLRGRSGEPRPRRAIALVLRHRAVTWDLPATVETDGDGRVELGDLDGIVRLLATAPSGVSHGWALDVAPPRTPPAVHVREGDDVVLPAPASLPAPSVAQGDPAMPATLVELRGSLPLRDAGAHLRIERGAFVLSGLPAGDYLLTPAGGGAPVKVTVVPASSPLVAGWAISGTELVELSPPLPVLRDASIEGDELVVRVTSATPWTRVHVLATRFVPSPLGGTAARAPRAPRRLPQTPIESLYVSGRELGDEYRYVLDRRTATRRAGTLLERPGLLLNPWALRTTTTATMVASAGTGYAAPLPPPAVTGWGGAAAPAPKRDTRGEEPAGYDFLPAAAAVTANLRPDERGEIRVPRAQLGGAVTLRIECVDPSLTTARVILLPEVPVAPRDLRLRIALLHDGHFVQDKRITGLPTGATLTIDDLATAKIQIVDTLAKAHAYLLTLTDNGDLRRFGFVTTWHQLSESEKRTKYSEHACHELHLFLYAKDPDFFAAVVRPFLAHKRDKTFLDRWLLGEDLSSYLEPWAFGRLNTVERVLLGRRVPAVQSAVARLLGDAVDLIPRDPGHDAGLIDALLAGGALDTDDEFGIAAATEAAKIALPEEAEREEADDETPMIEAAARMVAKESRAKRGRSADRSEMMAGDAPGNGPAGYNMPAGGAPAMMQASLMNGNIGGPPMLPPADLMLREQIDALYRSADKTQEWAESSWWHRGLDEMTADMIAPNRFWRDLAQHQDGPFLSAHLGDCTTSFAEALCALAFVELPFAAGSHKVDAADGRMTFVAASPCLIAHRQIVAIAQPPERAPILVGQSYFRADDRWEWDGAERREKYATGELLAGVVYTCRVVVTNPTAARAKLDVLVQVPRGALAVAGGLPTRTLQAAVEPYGTWSTEYAFYFPQPGRYGHFPAHVTRTGQLLAWAEPSVLTVAGEPSRGDTTSWAHLSQYGSLDEVVAFLAGANLGRIDLERVAWRLRDRGAFERITAVLAERLTYSDAVWAYALLHGDRRRLAEWLRHQDAIVGEAGPVLDGEFPLDAVARGWYQHLEYAPLVNARAHRLGARAQILNDGLDAQYRRFLDVVAHRAHPSGDDLLAAAHYLFTMDRIDAALAALARVDRAAVTTHVQYDYLAAYAATLEGKLAEARRLAAPWADHPVDRWRKRFTALLAMLDEVEGGARAAVVDADSRDQRMADLAARQPSVDLSVEGSGIVVVHQNLASCQVRLYRMDIELLFSRQPFVQGDTRRFSFIEPNAVLDVALTGARTRVPLPDAVRGANLVVEVTAAGMRKSIAHYAHDLLIQVAHQYGQVRVARASTGTGLPATYVKVYARHHGGAVQFYKDGYTDLRGRFDYATLSTDDLDRVERFAILVVSDDAGAAVTEADPPQR